MAGLRAPPRCSDGAAAAKKLLGRNIVRVDRILYVHEGRIAPKDGALELQLDDGSVLLLEAAADGETLSVSDGAWVDPFDGKLDHENQTFVAESGKWTRVAVSEEPLFSTLIGCPVLDVAILENQFGREAGLAIGTPARTIWFVVEGDEAHVYWAMPLGYRSRPQHIDGEDQPDREN